MNITAQPAIQTARLLLRPFSPSDADRFAELAGSKRVSDAMISVPHPFTRAMALETIKHYTDDFAAGTGAHFAMCLVAAPSELIGYVGIRHIDREHLEGELSFWVDDCRAGLGFATEAAIASVDFAFGALELNRTCAFHMVKNEASRRVLQRIGMRQEGYLRQRVRKPGGFEDVLV